MKEYLKYMEIIEKCYNKPPNTYLSYLRRIIEKYPTIFKDIKNDNEIVACACVVILNNGFYGISSVAVLPEFQKRGFGLKLMKKIHDDIKGIFLLRTRTAKKFFQKVGYTEFFKNDTHSFMIYSNEENVIDF
jgi:N-acetylglutamate synthase-like GNAT family acetyltransferase